MIKEQVAPKIISVARFRSSINEQELDPLLADDLMPGEHGASTKRGQIVQAEADPPRIAQVRRRRPVNRVDSMNENLTESLLALAAFFLPFAVLGFALVLTLIATGRADLSNRNRIEPDPKIHFVAGLTDLAHDMDF